MPVVWPSLLETYATLWKAQQQLAALEHVAAAAEAFTKVAVVLLLLGTPTPPRILT